MKIRIKNKRSTGVAFAMSDIAFLLLIFLVITASINESGEVQLPEFLFLQKDNSPVKVNIALELDGMILVEGQPAAQSTFTQMINNSYPLKDVVIRLYADHRCTFEQVEEILALLKAEGYLQIFLAAEEEQS